MGKVLNVYLRPSSRTPVRDVAEAKALPGKGLEGDHAGGGRRQVTLLAREAWEAACAQLGIELDPGARRANLLIEGVDLADSRGRTVKVGGVRIRITGETKPCQLMDDTHLGLRDALVPDWRGGAFGELLDAGVIRPGDAVELLEDED